MQSISMLKAVIRDDRGATAIEYGLILALIAIAIIAALDGVARETIAMWLYVEEEVTEATS